jgi:hypothetical protein
MVRTRLKQRGTRYGLLHITSYIRMRVLLALQ